MNAQIKVLVADDDVSVRRLLTRHFERNGYDVRVAHRGDDALEIARNAKQLHLVVSDNDMPGVQGSDLLQQVATLHPAATNILVSGRSLPDCSSAIHATLSKPFRLAQLASLLESLPFARLQDPPLEPAGAGALASAR